MIASHPTLDWLGQQQPAMLHLLENLVNIDSGSYDKAGVDAVETAIAAYLESEGVAVERLPMPASGDILRASVPGASNAPVILMGHCDTVFPKGEVERRPFRIEDGRAYGPGVADMKAGLVMNAFVLAAFQRFGGNQAPLLGLFTCDEEIASPVSRAVIEGTARGARAVLNAEPGRPNGNVVTRRKGGVFMAFETKGRAAHAGGAYADGRSAILDAAHKIVALHGLTHLERGITVNVGLIGGGQSVNTVAPDCRGEIDLRYLEPADRAAMIEAITEIVTTPAVPDTVTTLTIKGEFLPLSAAPGSDALFQAYRAASAELGLSVEGELSGGCADSGLTAAVGAPTLCSTGPVGGRAHTVEEYLEVESIVPRALALARTILALPPG